MPPSANSSALSSILHQRCPRCRVGSIFRSSIFRGLPKMYERCAVCGLKFEREPGYFLGAMYISYGLALGTITVLAVGLWAGTGWPITKVVLWAVGLFLPLAPSLTLLARVLWLYLDQARRSRTPTIARRGRLPPLTLSRPPNSQNSPNSIIPFRI